MTLSSHVSDLESSIGFIKCECQAKCTCKIWIKKGIDEDND